MTKLKPYEKIWTLRTAFDEHALRILVAANTNPATNTRLRHRLIAECNARDFSWARADDLGIWHQGDRDVLHPRITRSALITWQQLWDCIGPNITPANVAELQAATADVERDRALVAGGEPARHIGSRSFRRVHHAVCAFYSLPKSAAQAQREGQSNLFDLIGAYA